MGAIIGLMLAAFFYGSVAAAIMATYCGVFLRFEQMWCYIAGAVSLILLIDRIVRNDPRNKKGTK